MYDVAFVSALDAIAVDEDLPKLRQVAEAAGLSCTVWAWDDPTVDWSAARVALLRSPWNYTERYADFVAWLDRAAAQTRLENPAELVRWNTDKRYLLDLAKAGAPVIDTLAIVPGDSLQIPDAAEFVLKPAIGAGSKGARRFRREQLDEATAHLRLLHSRNQVALAQPYLNRVDHGGETGLLFFDGEFSHAICKGPLLRSDAGEVQGLFAAETISARVPSGLQMETAHAVLSALASVRGTTAPPLYARVDLLDDDAGHPQLLELELAEPSLFFDHAPGSAERFVQRLKLRVGRMTGLRGGVNEGAEG